MKFLFTKKELNQVAAANSWGMATDPKTGEFMTFTRLDDALRSVQARRAAWPWHKKLRMQVKWKTANTRDWLRDLYERKHLLDLRNRFYTSRGWCDRDHQLLYAAFNILVEFIEQEKPFDHLERSPEVEAELKALYKWWTVERVDQFGDLEAYEKDNEMLCRLIVVRKYLWT